jgi:hypothetical protein
MPWKDALYLVAAVLLVFALGAAASVFSEKPALQKGAHLLWAVAVLCLTAALAYVITAHTLNWF